MRYETITAKNFISFYNKYSNRQKIRDKTIKYPIGEHLQYLSDNAMKYGIHIEAFHNRNKEWLLGVQLNILQTSTNNLIKCFEEYFKDPESDYAFQQLRYCAGMIIPNLLEIRTSAMWITMPIFLNDNYPFENKLFWFANTTQLRSSVKKMLEGIEKCKFDEYGYPQSRGAIKFLTTFNFPACALINNPHILPIEWFRFNTILNKIYYSIIVEKSGQRRKFNQFKSYLQSILQVVDRADTIRKNKRQKHPKGFKPHVEDVKQAN